MKSRHSLAFCLPLFALGSLVCLSAGTAEAQNARRQSTRSAGTMSCPSKGSNSGSTTTTGSTGTTSGTTTGTTPSTLSAQNNYTVLAQRLNGQGQNGASNNGGLTAQRLSTDQLLVQWNGNTNGVQRVYLATLDANQNVVQQQVVTQLPVQARLGLTSTTSQYAVKVVYANGTSQVYSASLR